MTVQSNGSLEDGETDYAGNDALYVQSKGIKLQLFTKIYLGIDYVN